MRLKAAGAFVNELSLRSEKMLRALTSFIVFVVAHWGARDVDRNGADGVPASRENYVGGC